MKNIYTFITLVVLAIVFIFSGCKKESNTGEPILSPVRDTLSVVLSGYTYVASSVEPFISEVNTSIIVKGIKGDLLFVLNLDDEITPGEYPAAGIIHYYADNTSAYNAVDGNIRITLHDFSSKIITGNFSCTLENPYDHSQWISAKDGIFVVHY